LLLSLMIIDYFLHASTISLMAFFLSSPLMPRRR